MQYDRWYVKNYVINKFSVPIDEDWLWNYLDNLTGKEEMSEEILVKDYLKFKKSELDDGVVYQSNKTRRRI